MHPPAGVCASIGQPVNNRRADLLGEESRSHPGQPSARRFAAFHFPRRKIQALASASVENATVMAAIRLADRGRWNEKRPGERHLPKQKHTALRRVGVQVSPAPLMALVRTMPYA